jgi:hypothetical protein
MSREVHGEFTRADVPDLQRGVLRRGHEQARIGGETALVYSAYMAPESGDEPKWPG